MCSHRLFRLKNTIQHYDWGSRHALKALFGIKNPDNQPQAEIWMGAHPKSPSLAEVSTNEYLPLNDLIAQQGSALLGQSVIHRFGRQLPYLFKVLSAAEPLSIQAHPSKQQAEQGFKEENQKNIPLSAAFRNYKDDNHKPELIYALTPFKAMNGFRPIEDIISLFRALNNTTINTYLAMLEASPNEAGLKAFYGALMRTPDQQIKAIIKDAVTAADTDSQDAFQTLRDLVKQYPEDRGVLSPLLLHVVTLKPGEAMFLEAGTLHAYLEGTGLEVMASSDNVLRGGLTPKHVDVPELLKTIRFTPLPFEQIKLKPLLQDNTTEFLVPVDDFTFSVMALSGQRVTKKAATITLLFCKQGELEIQTTNSQLTLIAGESCIAPAGIDYETSGSGELVVVGTGPEVIA